MAAEPRIQSVDIPVFEFPFRRMVFTGIGLDRGAAKMILSADRARVEIPVHAGTPDMAARAIVPIRERRLTAVAGSPLGVYVYDQVSGSIQGEGNTYPLSIEIELAGGLAWHQRALYLADQGQSVIHQIVLHPDRAEVRQTFSAPYDISGLSSDGTVLYSCAQNKLYRHGDNFDIIEAFSLPGTVSGLASYGRGKLWALAADGSVLYQIDF